MKYIFLNQNELMADIVIDILQSEKINYKLESKKIGWENSDYIYNITIDTTSEYILFITKLVNEKLAPYLNAERSFMLPDAIPKGENKPLDVTVTVNQNTPIITVDDVQVVTMPEPKKSLLKRLVDWLTK